MSGQRSAGLNDERGRPSLIAPPAVRAEGLSFTYSTRLRPALTGLTFTLNPGETVLVLGPSGSGKSTLTLCLDGLIPHLVEGDYCGRVTVAGLVVGETPVRVLARETGLVFQDPESQFCTLTVDDEIAFGLENLETPPEEMDAAIDRALGQVRLPHLRGRPLAGLSGGEKQRVALAAVLAMGPQLLVLDEPSANLDPAATTELFAIVRGLAADRQHTIVIIEHKLDEVIDWVDGVLALDGKGGLLFQSDPRAAFYDHAARVRAAGIWRPQTVELADGLVGAGWPVPGRPLTVAETAATIREASGLVQRLRTAWPEEPVLKGAALRGGASPAIGSDVLISVRHLDFSYPGGPPVLEDVSLDVRRGDFLAIVGGNGVGKTTLGSLVSGILRPPRGTVFLGGIDAADMPSWAIAERVGHVFQNPEHQFVSSTVRGELVYSLRPTERGRSLHPAPDGLRLVDEWLDRLGLLGLAEANPFTLSHGQKRRLSVAAILIRRCPLLLLDEPTLGQDAAQSETLLDMLHEFHVGGGTVVMITHDMRVVAERAGSVLALARGGPIYSGDSQGLFADPKVLEAARLTVPAIARLGLLLRESDGIPGGLLTVRDFLAAAGAHGGGA